jgi:hypothetical protein
LSSNSDSGTLQGVQRHARVLGIQQTIESTRLILAEAKDRLTLRRLTCAFGTFGDLYLTLVEGVLDPGMDAFPSATKRLPGILT